MSARPLRGNDKQQIALSKFAQRRLWLKSGATQRLETATIWARRDFRPTERRDVRELPGL
jgi:hypothetical protein